MGKYSQTHYTDILGVHGTNKTNHETGEKAKGYGWTYKESDKDADKTGLNYGGSWAAVTFKVR